METNNISLTPIQRFWRLLKPDRREIRNVYIYAIFNGLVSLSLPLGIQAIVNLIQGGQINSSWVILVTFVVLGVLISGVLQIHQLRITENLQQKIFTRAAFEFSYRLPRIRLEALYKHYAPELMNRFFDIISVQKGLPKVLIDFLTASLQAIFGLILLSFYHPFFILFSLLLIALIYTIFRFTGKNGLTTSLEESKHKYRMAHWLEDLARTATTLKLAGKTDLPLHMTDDHAGEYLKARRSHFRILVKQYSLMVIFKVLVATGLLAIGGILVMKQLMNIGQFIAAEIIILLIMNSVEKLILSLETIYDVLTALAKIGEVTDLELEKEFGMEVEDQFTDGGMRIELNDVTFSYPGQTLKILNKLSLAIENGERLTITGDNNSGKSTLLKILAGLYDVQQGNISYNDLPKGNLDPASLRELIGGAYSDQETLFEGTILENITLGRKTASFKNVQWVIENIGLSSWIKSLPHGYETELEPRGKNVAGSIAQKLLLARSIVHKPKILIIEDTFHRINVKDRKQIIDFLMNRENQWTVVMISNDPYVARSSDRVALMKSGEVVQIGSYTTIQSNLKMESHA
ncbi:ATP-binding cassette domain-containing protein [Fulvivirgaceae bacterium BMA10]|uniref:ATP-binding cassette domain-containing protein n=1 Tax=Splendidivirga corallicola TaxID=3051826 RepID=A0ABT8KJI8_9BACT|nr:ATP-binding cassette domain-containing protein [Fulvivirgaceae bacterium BMA10]